MRRNLPKTLFTKSDTIELIRKVQQVSPAELNGNNIENIFEDIEKFITIENNKNVLKEIKSILKTKFEKN